MNLGNCLEEKGEKGKTILFCSRQPHGGEGSSEMLEKAQLASCQYFKGHRKKKLDHLE